MGLDDFMEDDSVDSEVNEDLRKKLDEIEPPDEDTWKEQEPGVPDWVAFIEGRIEDRDDLEQLKIRMSVNDPDSNFKIVSSDFLDLDECQ